MVRKILVLSASVALFANHPASAVCEEDLEMHGQRITRLSVPQQEMVGQDLSGDAANKKYIDDYVKRLDVNRNNGTRLSSEFAQDVAWFGAQDYCNELVSPALDETGTVSKEEYNDWHLPSRIEWLSACLYQGSQLDYDKKTWTADGLCKDYNSAFWTREFHSTPTGWPHEDPWSAFETRLDKYDLLITGKAETFDPATGESMRINADLERDVRCIR